MVLTNSEKQERRTDIYEALKEYITTQSAFIFKNKMNFDSKEFEEFKKSLEPFEKIIGVRVLNQLVRKTKNKLKGDNN